MLLKIRKDKLLEKKILNTIFSTQIAKQITNDYDEVTLVFYSVKFKIILVNYKIDTCFYETVVVEVVK